MLLTETTPLISPVIEDFSFPFFSFYLFFSILSFFLTLVLTFFFFSFLISLFKFVFPFSCSYLKKLVFSVFLSSYCCRDIDAVYDCQSVEYSIYIYVICYILTLYLKTFHVNKLNVTHFFLFPSLPPVLHSISLQKAL